MSFEAEKLGIQHAYEALNVAMTRGAFNIDDLDLLSNARNGLRSQYTLLEGGLAAVIGGQPLDAPKLAIPQPAPEEEEEAQNTKRKVKNQ